MKFCLQRLSVKRVLSLLACASLTLCFSACGARPAGNSQQPGTPHPPASTGSASSSQPGTVGMANPLVEMPDWRALHEAVDVEVTAPPHAENVRYYVLDKHIAQINFTLYGVEYVLRGTERPDDIAGVYGDFTDLGSFLVFAGDDMAIVRASTTADTAVYRWAWEDEYYTLIGRGKEEDVSQYMAVDPAALTLTDGPAVYLPGEPRAGAEAARICAELSSGEAEDNERGEPSELAEYSADTRNSHAAAQLSPLVLQFNRIGSVLERDVCLNASDGKASDYGLHCTVVDTNNEKITWQEFLRRHESAVVTETHYTLRQGEAVSIGYSYQLMMPAASGDYATIGCIFRP